MKNINTPQKFILAFLLLFVLPMASMVFISNYNYSKTIKTNTISYVTWISDEIAGRINAQINEMKLLTKTPYFLNDMQKVGEKRLDELETQKETGKHPYQRLACKCSPLVERFRWNSSFCGSSYGFGCDCRYNYCG